MSRRAKVITAIVVIVVIVAAGAAYAAKSSSGGPVVQTAKVAKTSLSVSVSASGKVTANGQADVYPPTQGVLAAVYVTDGATVSAGAKLAALDTAPLEAALAQAEAGLAAAVSGRANLAAQLPSSADVAAGRANVSAACAAYSSAASASAEASAAYALAKTVAESNPASPGAQAAAALAGTANRNAKVGVKQAYAGLKSAQAALVKTQAPDGDAQRFAADAQIRSAASAVSLAQQNLDGAVMVAPQDGVVLFNALGAPGADGASPKAAVGVAVAPAAAPFTVVDLSSSVFEAQVDEADIARVSVGMSGTVTLDAYPGRDFTSKVTGIGKAAQATATGGTIFPVDLALSGSDANLLIGMKGDAQIEVSALSGAITIPVEALFNSNGQNYVYVVEAGKLKKTDITVGATTDTSVQVIKGLTPGEVVALSGATQYTDGMAVRTQ